VGSEGAPLRQPVAGLPQVDCLRTSYSGVVMTNLPVPPPPMETLSVTLPPGPWPQNGGAEIESEIESVLEPGSSRVKARVATVYMALAVMSVGASGIHFAVMGEHFQEYVVFGVFVSLVAWFQALWALGVVVAPTRWTLAVGFIAYAAIVCVWLVSRTAGVPIGPEPGVAEPAGLLDVLSTVLGLLIVAVCAALLLRGQYSQPSGGRRARTLFVGALALGLIVLSTIGIAAAGENEHGHGEEQHGGTMHTEVP
jgi:hypothetical protein